MFDLERRGTARVLTLKHPPVNAISDVWLGGFASILDDLEGDGGWTVLHLRSAEKVFCAGADLKEYRERMSRPDSADAYEAYLRRFHSVFSRLESLAGITLAEIGGAALGGGFELALACDLRVAADEAKLGLQEGHLGLIPGAGGTQRLTRLCGPGTAARLILGCETVGGAAARELGMVQWSFPIGRLDSEARAITDRLESLSPGAIGGAKSCIAACLDPGQDGFEREIEVSLRLIQTEDAQQRVRAFFAHRKD